MKISTLIFLFFLFIFSSHAQNNFRALVKDSASNEPIEGVTVGVLNTILAETSDEKGRVIIHKIPDGTQNIVFYYLGYKKIILTIDFPNDSKKTVVVQMVEDRTDLNEVVVSASRTNSRIEDLPSKVEVLGQEDMDEESTIVPGNVSSILGDLSIITIQRTNQLNGNETIRMQGLDSKYTQLMRDGLPLYGGFSGSLGVLSIPPLDLKQVEIIKGCASTLYGGGAIGGLINFVSKTPADTMTATITVNATSLGEGNFNGFTSGKIKKTGFTFFVGENFNQALDINGDGFAEVPLKKNFQIHPRIFFEINPSTQINVGYSFNFDERKGGDIQAIDFGASETFPFFQKEKTFRNTLDFSFSKEISKANTFSIKSAGSAFERDVNYSGFIFNGTQYSTFTELNDLIKLKKNTLVVGLNFVSENFDLINANAPKFSNYDYYTAGIFLQDDFEIHKKLTLQIGARYDYHFTFGSFYLPRISFLYKPKSKISFRLAGGTGYKTPNIFDVAEPSANFNSVTKTTKSENSVGINADINYHTVLFKVLNVQVNQAFYYTQVKNPVIEILDSTNNIFAGNGIYHAKSYGSDTYIRFKLYDFELYLGFNHTEALQQYDTFNLNIPFNPKDKFSSTLAYDIEGKWRMGVEAAFTANQFIYDNKKVSDFWFMAAMVERKFKFGSLVLNCENILDNRQSNYETIVEGSRQSPIFKPVWTSLEGRVINLSVKITL